MTGHSLDHHDPTSPVVVRPVGAVVTPDGVTFALEPVNVSAQPHRLRCTSCPWQATVTGPDELRQETTRHAAAHQHTPAHQQNTAPRAALASLLHRLKGTA